MSDLFTASRDKDRPLAAEMRPRKLEDVIGQRHLLDPGKPFRTRVESGRLGTVVMFGPPGIGKTSIARAIGNSMGKEFRQLHPAHDKVAQIKEVADEAKFKNILLFIDEVHRYSSTQQDYLLSMTEDGIFDFIAATTENPYFSLTKALVSRATIFKLEPLVQEDIEEVAMRALEHLARKGTHLSIDEAVLKTIAARSGGDARRAVNIVDDLSRGAKPGVKLVIRQDMVDDLLAAAPTAYDRTGDAHYDITSAFVKSMRGSDPDATLYWLARLIHGGEDPRYIARRIMIHASEDVGLADNAALQTAAAALQAVENVGYPEARIILAHAALHVALAPKSNSAYRGIAAALEYVQKEAALPVPMHLRDTHYSGAAKLGHVGYAFPHADPAGWVDQDYAPGIPRGAFYQSDARGGGTFERRAGQFWEGVTGRPTPARFGDGE